MYNLIKFPLLFFTLSLFLVSCTSEEVSQDLNESTADEISFANRVDSPNLTTYLDNKYPNGYTFGYERTFLEDDDTFVVKEVFANGEIDVSGFVNLTNGDFTQYLELQRARDMILIDDFVNDELYEFDASDPDNQEIFDRNFLENLNEPVETAGKRFWGWSCSVERHPSIQPNDCYRTCCYKVFWGSVTCSDYTCGDEPGSDPVLP